MLIMLKDKISQTDRPEEERNNEIIEEDGGYFVKSKFTYWNDEEEMLETIDELEGKGFDRSEISIMPPLGQVERALGHQVYDIYATSNDPEDDVLTAERSAVTVATLSSGLIAVAPASAYVLPTVTEAGLFPRIVMVGGFLSFLHATNAIIKARLNKEINFLFLIVTNLISTKIMKTTICFSLRQIFYSINCKIGVKKQHQLRRSWCYCFELKLVDGVLVISSKQYGVNLYELHLIINQINTHL